MKNILALAIVAVASSSFAVTFTSASAVGTLADQVGSTPGVTTNVITVGSGILSVESITLRGLSHTWAGDLIITVTAPSGASVDLVRRAGATTGTSFGDSSNFLNADLTFEVGGADLWAAAAAAPATGSLIAGGTYAPSTNLFGGTVATSYATTNYSSFANQTAGNWTISITDAASGDTGSAGNWEINATPVPEPATMTALALGLAAVARRRKNA